MKDYYAILGVTPTATLEEIEAAYRQKAKQYHPDKVSHLGPEFRELAERRMKEINEAYQALIKLLGGTQYRSYKQSASEQHEKTTENKTAPGTAQDVKTPEAEVVTTKTRFRKSTIILMLLVFLAGFLAVLSLNRVENLAQQLSASTLQNQKLADKVSALEQTRASPSLSQQIAYLANEVRQLAQRVYVLELTRERERNRIVASGQVQPNEQTQATSVDIGDGFSVSHVNFTSYFGSLKAIGQITNNSQRNYFLPDFDIRLYDSKGKFIGGEQFTISGDLLSKKTRSFEVIFSDIPANTKVGKYVIQFAG